MKKQKSLKLNFIMNAMLTMSSFIFPLITFPYVSRILLAEGTGKVQFATSLISYFTMFSQLGVPTYGIRAVAGVRDDKEQLSRTVQELFILRLVTTAISYTAFFILLATVPRLQGEKLLYVIMSANTFLTFIGMEWLYKGLEHYTYITIRQITVKFLSLILMFALVHQKSDYIIYGAIAVFAGAASNIFNFIHARRYVYFRPMGNWNVRRHIKPVLVFFALSCATMIYTHLDTVMLGFMKTDTDVGYYGAAVKIKTLLVSIVTSLGTVLLPRASYYVKKGDMEKFRAITSKALRFVMLMATPLVIYFMLFASSGIRLLSGSGYDGAIVPMILIMPTLLFIGMSNITGLQILVPTGREKLVLYSTIAGAVIDVIINAVLIPSIASSGAAIGTLVAEFVVLLIQCWFLQEELKPIFRAMEFRKFLPALGLAVLASAWTLGITFAEGTLGAFLKLLVSAALYFSVYLGFLLITRETLAVDIVFTTLGNLKKKLFRKRG